MSVDRGTVRDTGRGTRHGTGPVDVTGGSPAAQGPAQGAAPGAAQGTAQRVMVLWCPDWPVNAALVDAGLPADTAAALVNRGEVFACSPAARAQGVKRGQRVRQAQSLYPQLSVLPYDPGVDERHFEPVVAAVEEIMPGVQVLRPGCCAIRAKGPARYFGGEQAAAQVLLRSVDSLVSAQARVGIADGIFAAEQAARHSNQVRIVAPGASADFLSSFSLDALQQPELMVVLQHLGLKTLGDFAALEPASVTQRFGVAGGRAHQLASGQDCRQVTPQPPTPPLEVHVQLESAVERVDQLAFTVRADAQKFIDQLDQSGLVCTELRIQVAFETFGASASGGAVQRLERVWKHPRFFTADEVVDRLRWQVQESAQPAVSDAAADAGARVSELQAGVLGVVLAPEKTDLLSHHHRGLWGNGPQEQVHHGLSRIQGMLGHGAVLTATLTGGRLLNQRKVLVPWGDAPPENAGELLAQPWPGSVSGPAPATLFAAPEPVQVLDPSGAPVSVDERLNLSAQPRYFTQASGREEVAAWAGPWPIQERWWENGGVLLHRFQVVTESGSAWLLLFRQGQWFAEAQYD